MTAGGQTVGRDVYYDANGRALKVWRGSVGTATQLDTVRSFDPNTGRLAGVETTNSAGVKVQDLDYSYSADGMATGIKDTSVPAGTAFNTTTCAAYDALDQLVRAWTRSDHNCATANSDFAGAAPFQNNYSYDALHRITNATGWGTVGGSYTYAETGNAGPHAVTTAAGRSYTYDAAGNRATATTSAGTDSYEFDVQNRLLAITGNGEGAGTSNLYLAGGDRVSGFRPAERRFMWKAATNTQPLESTPYT